MKLENFKKLPEPRVMKLFLDKVYFTKHYCWEWTGSKNEFGHGTFVYKSRKQKAHRFLYSIYGTEKLSKNKFLCHKCDNPSCVRPDHMFVGTQKDNMRDCSKKGRLNTLTGEGRPNAKLTERDVSQIRKLHKSGVSSSVLLKMYDVRRATIWGIVNRKSWKHI